MTDPPAIDPRRIQWLPLGGLSPDPRNPKAHDQDTIDASIGRFGMLDLIVRDERTGHIVSGHGRAKALTAMRDRGETVPEGVKVGAGGEWMVPVVTGWASRTDTDAAAALIALNRTTELGGWVDEALLGLLDQISAGGEALTGVGFDLDDIDDLRVRLEAVAAVDALPGFDTPTPPPDGTRVTPSMAEYAERYEAQGRRLVVMDFDHADYPEVIARLRALRRDTSTDNNSAALLALLMTTYPVLPTFDTPDPAEATSPDVAADAPS